MKTRFFSDKDKDDMKRTKLKIEILTVIFCSLIFAFSGKYNSIYADEVLTDTELPTGRLLFEEETEEADEEDYESSYEYGIEEQSLLRQANASGDDWEKYGTYYFYNQLSDEEREYWDALDAICENYLTTETDAVTTKSGAYRMQAISGSSLTKAQQKSVLLMFRYSNPQYYFLNAIIYTISYSNGKVSMIFGIYPAFGKGSDRMEETEKVKEQVDNWQEQIDTCSTDFEKVQKIHDLICEKVYYNQALVNNNFSTENTEYSQSAYSVFCTDKTVCAGYAQSFAMMCNGSGIDTAVVTSSNHEWNKVRLDDSWYNVDCTWDDQSSGVYYNYFIRNDEYYDTCSTYSKTCHAEEDYWEEYLPVCSLDSGASRSDCGKLPVISKKALEPEIIAVNVGDKYYIEITDGTEGAKLYYNLNGITPVVASEKNYLYKEGFYIDKDLSAKLQAIAVADTYYDSDAASEIQIGECEHKYEVTVTKEAACTAVGIRTYTCTICGNSYEEEIPATGHTAVTDIAVAATCTTTGLTEGSHCSVCGEVLTEQTIIPMLDHTPVADTAVAASCESTGLTEGSHCSVCGKVLTEQTVVPAAGHKWSEYKESGKLKRKCSVCGKTETVSTLPKVKTVQLSKTSYTYDGKSHMPTVKVTNSAGKKLKEGTDYKVKKPSGRKNTGIYTVTIEMKGDYTGKYQKTFQIVPKAASISGVKAKKKAFTVSWKKQTAQTNGYQIQYAVDAKFKKSVVTKNIGNTKKVKLDATKLKAKKKYYIRIRTYKTVKVNGKSKKIYSGWSKVKTVTTKK